MPRVKPRRGRPPLPAPERAEPEVVAPPGPAVISGGTAERGLLGIPKPWVEVITVVGGAISIIIAYLGYQQRLDEGRARETLALVDVWEERGYRTAFQELATQAQAYMDAMDEDERAQIAADEQSKTIGLSQIGRRIADGRIDGAPAASKIDDLVYFFTRLSICVEAGLCSREVSKACFGDTTRTFWRYFAGYAEGKRDYYPSFGSDLERFVNSQNE